MDRPGEPDHELHLTWGNWTNKNWSDLTSLLRNSFLLRSLRLLLPFPIFSEKQQHHHYSVPIKSEYTHFIKEIRMFLQTSNCLLSLRALIHLRSVKAIFMQNLYNSLYILRQYLEDIIGLCITHHKHKYDQLCSFFCHLIHLISSEIVTSYILSAMIRIIKISTLRIVQQWGVFFGKPCRSLGQKYFQLKQLSRVFLGKKICINMFSKNSTCWCMNISYVLHVFHSSIFKYM